MTLVPAVKAAVHVAPQIPAGVLVIVPRVAALPILVTVSWWVAGAGPAAATVNGNVPVGSPAGLATETWTVPAAAISLAGIAAVTRVLQTNVVVRAAPFTALPRPRRSCCHLPSA